MSHNRDQRCDVPPAGVDEACYEAARKQAHWMASQIAAVIHHTPSGAWLLSDDEAAGSGAAIMRVSLS